jgi:hypothetical protein
MTFKFESGNNLNKSEEELKGDKRKVLEAQQRALTEEGETLEELDEALGESMKEEE